MLNVPYTLIDGKLYPVVKLFLEHKHNSIKTSALLDSGATVSVFNANVAEDLKINLEAGEKRVFQSATSKLVAYVHEINMVIDNQRFPCKIAFSNDLSTSLNLLGRETVFDKFIITFNEKNKEITLERVD